jgi:hypothetical protein
MSLDWLKRCQRTDTVAAERRTWKTRCGQYKVDEVNIRYGRSHDAQGNYQGYPLFFRACVMRDGDFRILSEHRTRKAAVSQLEYYHKHGRKKPRQTKANKAVKRVKAKRQAKRKLSFDKADS